MEFVAVLVAVLGVAAVAVGVIGAICPRLLKNLKTGQTPTSKEALNGGSIGGGLLLVLSVYLDTSVASFLFWAVPSGMVCAAVYAGFHAVRDAKKITTNNGVGAGRNCWAEQVGICANQRHQHPNTHGLKR